MYMCFNWSVRMSVYYKYPQLCLFPRTLLLNSMLLCAAAEAGDLAEVTRLLNHTPVSPNAKCLGHKTALHMASACSHVDIVNLLLLNGVSPMTDSVFDMYMSY